MNKAAKTNSTETVQLNAWNSWNKAILVRYEWSIKKRNREEEETSKMLKLQKWSHSKNAFTWTEWEESRKILQISEKENVQRRSGPQLCNSAIGMKASLWAVAFGDVATKEGEEATGVFFFLFFFHFSLSLKLRQWVARLAWVFVF